MTERLLFPPPITASPFRTPLAVDTWDAHFRWREDGRLRDVTVDATWQRVARVLAGGSLPLERELLDALAGWSLLPDPVLLANAGTGKSCTLVAPTASINLAAFVNAPQGMAASLDRTRLGEVAALAVRALTRASPSSQSLRIGVLGFGDALELLHADFGSAQACALARDIAQTLWCSAVEASADLVRNGAASYWPGDEWLLRARALGLAEPVLERIRTGGMRHARLCAITSQPLLSRFANCIGDALDPSGLRCEAQRCRVDGHPRNDAICHRRTKTPGGSDGVAAQLRIRAAMQPWMDEPIEYPLATRENFDETLQQQWRDIARHHALGDLAIEKI